MFVFNSNGFELFLVILSLLLLLSLDPLPDSFFEVTEEDVKKMMSDLRQRV